MANISRQRLAKRLLHNWFNKNPLDSISTGFCTTDDDVQSLGWLLNLNTDKENNFRIGSTENSTMMHSNTEATSIISSNSYEKPPYSYSNLTAMAINSTTEKKITISSLYTWISERFPYYKMTDSHWKNSIRHNLSINKRFEKVPRRPNESGKGGFWRLKTGSNETKIRDFPMMKRSAVDDSMNPAKRVRVSKRQPEVSYSSSGYNIDSFTNLREQKTYPTFNSCFNWSLPQPRNIYSLPIKSENLPKEEFFYKSMQSLPPSYDVDDDASRSSLLTSPSSDVSSDDLSCFDDLMVFSFNDKPGNKETEDGALDLAMPLDGNGDHDWWEKALNLSEECDVVSEKMTVINEDCKDFYIPPLDDIFTDICHMYSLE